MNRFISRFFKRCRPGIRARCEEGSGESGNSIVELALVVSIFCTPVLLGTADMATLVYDSIEISNAAHAGAMYGMMGSNVAVDTTDITSTAKGEASDFPSGNLTVTPTSYYACSANQGGTQYTGSGSQATAAADATATAACTGTNNYPLEFVQVQVSAPVTLPFACCGLPASITLNSKSVMEVY
ncbi:MAG: TadE family protein [Terracidiphilus sp.]